MRTSPEAPAAFSPAAFTPVSGGSGWRLIRESGIEYAAPDPMRAGEQLTHPVRAERDADGTYLIVDEPSHAKNLAVLFETRTLRVAPDGRVLFDSTERGIDDGYGCLMPGGELALLRRARWEVLVVGASGETTATLDITSASRRMPRVIAHTPRDTFLLAFVDRVYEVDLAEVDRSGRLLWSYTAPPRTLGCPTSLQLLPNDNVLLADEFGHIAIELRRDGSPAWHFGFWRNPSREVLHLSNPSTVLQTRDGTRLIADTRNDRVLIVRGDDVAPLVVQRPQFTAPTFATVLPDGHLLVCDAGNRRVIEIDEAGAVVWQYGSTLASRRSLSFPRSVELATNGLLLVADTCHDRVVEIAANDRVRVIAGSDDAGLFWPRCARYTRDGTVIVADGRMSRIVEVSRQGNVLRELRSLRLAGGDVELGDPHDVRVLAAGTLLVTDAQRDLVAETDWSGCVKWALGGRATPPHGGVSLKDPHSAQLLADGRVLIADSGNGRVLLADPRDGSSSAITHLSADDGMRRLHPPRYVEQSHDGTLLIVDTGNNRVFGATMTGEMLWEIADVSGSPLPTMFQPRWAQLVSETELLVSDHFQHRVLHFKRGPDAEEVGSTA